MSACRRSLPVSLLRSLTRLLLVALFASLAVALPSTSASAATAADPELCAAPIAHRGAFGPSIDEDTVAAIRAARAVGSAEIDVHVNADNHLIVMHDATVDRTTDGTGLVRDLTIEQIRALKTTPNGDAVPTLRQALRAAASVDLQIVVELKLASQWTPELYARVDRFWVKFTDLGATIYFGGKGQVFERMLPSYAPDVLIYWRPLAGESATVLTADEVGADMVMDWLSNWSTERVKQFQAAGFVTAARITPRLDDAAALGLQYALTNRWNSC